VIGLEPIVIVEQSNHIRAFRHGSLDANVPRRIAEVVVVFLQLHHLNTSRRQVPCTVNHQ